METLKDAIFVMKRVLRPPSIFSQDLCQTPNLTSYAEAKVNRASKRMANPRPVSSAISIDVVSQCTTFSHRSCPSDSVLGGGGSSSSTLSSPIRIEATDLISLEDRDADLESSIMLYNFGLAHLCMAKIVKTPIKLQEGALKLFYMAYTLFAPRCGQEGRGIRGDAVLLATANSTLDNIVALLTQMGRYSKANESDQELARLGRAIQEFQGRYHLEAQVCAAAAA
jgi:hypothetical protein